jgi:hypothetical protein
MERRQIKELLNRYYSGDCTDSEEQWLRYYFISGAVPDEFKVDQELFRALHEEKSSIPSEFSIDNFIEESVKSDPSFLPLKRNPIYKSIFFRVAAGVAILAACATILIYSYHPGTKSKHGSDTYSDPMLAYAEAKRTLQYVSVNLNHGTEKLQKLETFNYGLDKMNTLSIINLLQRN